MQKQLYMRTLRLSCNFDLSNKTNPTDAVIAVFNYVFCFYIVFYFIAFYYVIVIVITFYALNICQSSVNL